MSNLSKKEFSGAPVKCVFLCDSNSSDSVVFGNADFAHLKDHSFRMTPFQKKNYQWKFLVCVYLLKKVFSGAPVKCFSVYGLNNLDAVVFGNAAFGEIKDHSLRTTPFQKKPFLWKF